MLFTALSCRKFPLPDSNLKYFNRGLKISALIVWYSIMQKLSGQQSCDEFELFIWENVEATNTRKLSTAIRIMKSFSESLREK